MGYVAYAAGTLIVAVAIHSFYKRQTSAADENSPTKPSEYEPLRVKPSPEDKDRKHEKATVVVIPPVSIQVSHDGSDSSASNERDESPAHRNRTPQKVEQKKNVGALGMPPPPRPVTPSAAAQARQKDSMAPPAIVPPFSKSPPRLKPATASSLPSPRGPPGRQGGFASPTGLSSLTPPPSAASSARTGALQPPRTSLGVPQQKILANTHMQPSLAPSTSTQAPSKRSSKRVLLAPGHSPLDWAALTKSTATDAPVTLRGQDASTALGPHRLGRITPSQLKKQTGRKGKDAWTSYQGRVYNISAYLDFHPGGGDELMKGAGRSSDALFAEVHPWVNWEGMLGGCLIGMLVSEDDPGALGREASGGSQNELDEMD